MSKQEVSIIFINISKTPKIGVYIDNKLSEVYEFKDKISNYLSIAIEDIEKKYDMKSVVYINTPGSYMGIKLSYIFFKTYEILKGTEFLAVSGFYFNNNSPIKAMGNKYFYQVDGKVKLRNLEPNEEIEDFKLPERFIKKDFSKDILPNYVLDVV